MIVLKIYPLKGSTPRTNERRRLIRILDFADSRLSKEFVLCEWGCGLWIKRVYS